MKTEDAIKMIELCLNVIDNQTDITNLILKLMDRKIELASLQFSLPKKRHKKEALCEKIGESFGGDT